MVEGLPALARRLLESPEYMGGMLIACNDGSLEPSLEDLEKNYVMLRAIIASCLTHVPSGFLVADALLTAHELLGQRLLKVPRDDPNTIRTLALAHGCEVRRLVGKVRLLFRSSENSHSWEIQELKSLCRRRRLRTFPDAPTSWSPLKALAREAANLSNDEDTEDCTPKALRQLARAPPWVEMCVRALCVHWCSAFVCLREACVLGATACFRFTARACPNCCRKVPGIVDEKCQSTDSLLQMSWSS